MSSNTPPSEVIPHQPEPPDALLPYSPPTRSAYPLPPSALKKPPFNKAALAAAIAALALAFVSILGQGYLFNPPASLADTAIFMAEWVCLGVSVLADLFAGLALYFVLRSKGRQRGLIWAVIALVCSLFATAGAAMLFFFAVTCSVTWC